MAVESKPRGGAEPRTSRPTPTWIWQVVTGGLLLVLVTVHMVAHHFVVDEVGGLRDFAQVVAYIGNPLIVAVELAFLVVVTWHGLLGLRAILFDLGLSSRGERLVSRGLFGLGVVTIAYGVWLILAIAAKG